ncbi:hypothetical protein EYC56_14830 [Xanthomonas oryzae]|nr:hypothetical protein EYC54_09210 [Xanthomonas oryzae]QBH00322.1 hypothetical protein EYC56_14830 [Xanthomonas oryzae]QBH03411.1 hypothetical protein EYC57_08320 [Xanthomonas oryzae]
MVHEYSEHRPRPPGGERSRSVSRSTCAFHAHLTTACCVRVAASGVSRLQPRQPRLLAASRHREARHRMQPA